MGNCADSCFGSIRRKSNRDYFSGRYKDYNVGIEFESLIEDDLSQQSQHAAVTDSERDHLLNKRYSDLIRDQKRKDAEIDAELQRQEENIRLEEEAYIAAKRESSRAAHQARALEQQRTSKPIANGTAKSSWLGENESEWHVAGGEDDFEMFLESVKARSKTVRANGMPPNPYNSNTRSAHSDHYIANAKSKGGSVSTQEPSSSEPQELDSDFEPEFVGAETTVEQTQAQDKQPNIENAPVVSLIPPGHQNAAAIENAPTSENQNTAHMFDRKTIQKTVNETDSGIKTHASLEIGVDQSQEKTNTASVITDKDVAQEKTNSPFLASKEKIDTKVTELSTKSPGNLKTAVDDDPFDFDEFLKELDL